MILFYWIYSELRFYNNLKLAIKISIEDIYIINKIIIID